MGTVVLQVGLLLLFGSCIFAWAKGGPGERAGSTAVAIAWIASLAVLAFAPRGTHSLSLLFFDFALAAALLIIAIKYSSLWLGVAMLLQAFVLALHAQQLGDASIKVRLYIILLNGASAALLLAIVAATSASWMKRSRDQRPNKSPPPDALSAA